jgi:type I restriction enzyme S subunit
MKAGWEIKTLGEVCHFVRGPFGGSLKKSMFVESGIAVYEQQHAIYNQFDDIRYFIDDAKFEEMKRFELQPNDLIMSCSGTMGKVAIVPDNIQKGIINQALLKLTPSKAISSNFLSYWMTSPNFQNSLNEQSGGAAIQNVASVSILKEIKIKLPPPPEQKRLVTLLDEAFESIATAKANAQQNLKNARALFESHLNEVFTKRGEGWEDRTIGSIAEIKGGKRVPKGYKLLSEPTDYLYLRVADFTDEGSIDMSNLRYIDAEVHRQIKNYIIYSSDLYISIAGTIGKTGIIPEELNGANLTENACRLVFKSGINNRFIYYFTLTTNFIEQVGLNTRTSAQPKLALSRLSTIELGITSITEQKRLAMQFDTIIEETQRLEALYSRKIAALDELKKALLHRAFSGEL